MLPRGRAPPGCHLDGGEDLGCWGSAKGQPWDKLDIKLSSSLNPGEWKRGRKSLQNHVEKQGQLEDELSFIPELLLHLPEACC